MVQTCNEALLGGILLTGSVNLLEKKLNVFIGFLAESVYLEHWPRMTKSFAHFLLLN